MMTLHQFEELLKRHLLPKRAREIMKVYLEIAGEEIDQDYELKHGVPYGMTYLEYCNIRDCLNN